MSTQLRKDGIVADHMIHGMNKAVNDGRDARTRFAPSKMFQKSFKKVQQQREDIKIRKVEVAGDGLKFAFTLARKQNVRINKKFSSVIWHTQKATIAKEPQCDYEYASKNPNEVCEHIIWLLINIFSCATTSQILYQVAYTANEISLLAQSYPTVLPASLQRNGHSGSDARNETQEQQDPTNAEANKPLWKIIRFTKQPGTIPKCSNWRCNREINVGQIHVLVEGLFVPTKQDFAVDRKFRFCLDRECLKEKPRGSYLGTCRKLKLVAKLSNLEFAALLDTKIKYER